MSDRGVELMARKYVKTITIFEGTENDNEDIDVAINRWLEEKYTQVGTTITNFEILDVKLTHIVETKNTNAYMLALIIFTELRL